MSNKMAPDWAQLIEDLLTAGLTQKAVGECMGSILTDRMLRHYRVGAEPLYHRGRALITLWMSRTGKPESDVPMVEFIRGHRVARREPVQAVTINLPAWPPIAPVAVKPKRKYERKKVAA